MLTNATNKKKELKWNLLMGMMKMRAHFLLFLVLVVLVVSLAYQTIYEKTGDDALSNRRTRLPSPTSMCVVHSQVIVMS